MLMAMGDKDMFVNFGSINPCYPQLVSIDSSGHMQRDKDILEEIGDTQNSCLWPMGDNLWLKFSQLGGTMPTVSSRYGSVDPCAPSLKPINSSKSPATRQ